MSRICLVDSGSCARASRSLQMHRGYWHYPRYLDTKLLYKYVPIVILHISTERILGSGSCKTSCTKLKKVKNLLGRPPSDQKPRTQCKGTCKSELHYSRVLVQNSFGQPQELPGRRPNSIAYFAAPYRSCTNTAVLDRRLGICTFFFKNKIIIK